MYNKALFLLAFIAFGKCHDIAVGSAGSLIYNETVHASPALWRQDNNVTVAANNSEIISRIVVTDLREEKDGYVKIVEGGEGQTNVTFELKSPTVLRGYEFQIEVYAVSRDTFAREGSTETTSHGSKDATRPSDANVPAVLGKDENLRSARTMQDGERISLNMPKDVKEDTSTETALADSSTQMPESEAQGQDVNKEKQDAENHEIVDFVLNMDDQAEKSALRSENLKQEDESTEMATESATTDITTNLFDEISATASTSGYENEDIEKNIDAPSVPAIITKMVPPKDDTLSNERKRQDSRFELPRMHRLGN